jgi:hypothetical protein
VPQVQLESQVPLVRKAYKEVLVLQVQLESPEPLVRKAYKEVLVLQVQPELAQLVQLVLKVTHILHQLLIH